MYQRLFNLPLKSKDSFFIFGPRGTGKTAWLKKNLANTEHIYIDLLDNSLFRNLSAYPERLTNLIKPNFKGYIVIDEVQKIPELLDEVHRLIEKHHYQFILTGSSARKLKQKRVNLLAGRAIRYNMYPLVAQELKDSFDLEHALTLGMLPATYSYSDPNGYLSTYIDTFLREEVIQEGLTRNLSAFSRFLETASFSQGSTINASEIARDIGVDRNAVNNYFSILNDLLLTHWLPVFTKRAKRRLVSSEKFYYFDTGIFHHIRPKGFLDSTSEIGGVSLETLFLQSILALNNYLQLNFECYYWKTASGVEVDFVLYGKNDLIAFEIKHSKNIQRKMLTGLKHFKQDYPMAKCYILYLDKETLYFENDITAIPFEIALKDLDKLLQPKTH